MAQTNTSIGSKSAGSGLSASEVNELNGAINSNGSDIESRVTALGSSTNEARLGAIEDTDTSSVQSYFTDSLPSNLTNGAIAYDKDAEIPVYSNAGAWFRCSDNVSLSSLPLVDVYLLFGQSNADGKAAVTNLTETPTADLSSTLCYLSGIDGSQEFLAGTWGAINPGVNTAHASGRFGPEYGAAENAVLYRATQPTKYARDAVFLKCVKGATSLAENWDSTHVNNYMYKAMEKALPDGKFKLGQFGRRFRIRALLWYQGESDAGVQSRADNYESNLNALFSDIRTRVGLPNLPISISKVSYDSSPPTYLSTVRDALQNVADGDSNIVISDSQSYSKRDAVHLDADGMFLFGKKMFEVLDTIL